MLIVNVLPRETKTKATIEFQNKKKKEKMVWLTKQVWQMINEILTEMTNGGYGYNNDCLIDD